MTYRVCSSCIMDTSDPSIEFDSDGECDHCLQFKEITKPIWEKNLKVGEIDKIINKIRSSNTNSRYNCILGLSGGIDSSYMLHLAVKKYKLRPLVFHVDGGWNSSISSSNIENLVRSLDLDLFTEVINWEEMRLFQLAFLKSGVPHIDIPQDLAFIATLYKYANKNNIKWILNGGNISTECVRNPLTYYYYGTDMKHNNYIRKNFGANNMPTYPFSSILWHKLWLRYFKRIKVFKLLNFVDYNKSKAIEILSKEYNWEPYPQKHFESRFTRFFEGYWLPERFGFDPRRVQYSSLILTKQISRDESLVKISNNSISKEELEIEFKFISDKLSISTKELLDLCKLPLKYYWDYPNSDRLFKLGAKVLQYIGSESSIKR